MQTLGAMEIDIWDVTEEVIKNASSGAHYTFDISQPLTYLELARSPSHPRLIEAYNADSDGDQMPSVPLKEAQKQKLVS